MRISDLSSDVCSSDLPRFSCWKSGRGQEPGLRWGDSAFNRPRPGALGDSLAALDEDFQVLLVDTGAAADREVHDRDLTGRDEFVDRADGPEPQEIGRAPLRGRVGREV